MNTPNRPPSLKRIDDVIVEVQNELRNYPVTPAQVHFQQAALNMLEGVRMILRAGCRAVSGGQDDVYESIPTGR